VLPGSRAAQRLLPSLSCVGGGPLRGGLWRIFERSNRCRRNVQGRKWNARDVDGRLGDNAAVRDGFIELDGVRDRFADLDGDLGSERRLRPAARPL
jgi:hypothetical protein